MIYPKAKDWLAAERKRVLLFGMSGLGKTHVSNLLRTSGGWYHYSIDYRIGTRYMGEHIADNAKREAMRVPFLRDLLLSDSIYIGSNITFGNLAPLSAYLGKPGDPSKGGLPIAEYKRRQDQHMRAEIAALEDTAHFIERAESIYDYKNFVCDSSGSICEVADPSDPKDPVLTLLAKTVLPIWIEGDDAHAAELMRRFDADPKPMCYQPAFMDNAWRDYLAETGTAEEKVDPDAFVRWAFARAMAHRRPRYRKMAENWGIRVSADDLGRIQSTGDFIDLVAGSLPD